MNKTLILTIALGIASTFCLFSFLSEAAQFDAAGYPGKALACLGSSCVFMIVSGIAFAETVHQITKN